MCDDPKHDELMQRMVLEVKNLINPINNRLGIFEAEQNGKMNEILNILESHKELFTFSRNEINEIREIADRADELSKKNADRLNNYKWFARTSSSAVIVLLATTIWEFIRR